MSAPLPRESGPAMQLRELDALIAEKVMGWSAVRMGVSTGPNRWDGDREIAKPLDTPKGRRPGAARHGGLSSVPCYSTSIADAWLVVEKMYQRGFAADLRRTFDGFSAEFDDFSQNFHASVDPREGGMALAICRAALYVAAVPPTPGGRDHG